MFTIAVLNVILYPIERYRQKTYAEGQVPRRADAPWPLPLLQSMERRPPEYFILHKLLSVV
jgi:hypothetical protein